MPLQSPLFFRTNGHLLVCQGQNCQARGSRLLHQALWNHLDRSHQAYYKTGGKVRLTESGCLGACSFGPTLCVYRQSSQPESPEALPRSAVPAVPDESDGSDGSVGSAVPVGSVGGYLEEGWYATVDFPLAARIAQAVQDGAPLPSEHKYGP